MEIRFDSINVVLWAMAGRPSNRVRPQRGGCAIDRLAGKSDRSVSSRYPGHCDESPPSSFHVTCIRPKGLPHPRMRAALQIAAYNNDPGGRGGGGLANPRCDLPVRATGIFRPRIPLRVWQSITTSLPPEPSDLPTLPTCSPCPFLTCIPSLLVKSRKRGGTVPSPRTPLALAGQIQHARKRDLPNLPFNVPCPKIDGIQCIGSWRRWFPWRIGTWVERSPEPDK